MITTAAAILGAAVLGAGATALSSSNASHAAQSAADAQAQASQANIAENAREFDTIQNNNANARRAGDASLSAIGGAFGLPGYGASAPTMTGASSYGSTAVSGAGGVSMTGAMTDAEKARWDTYLGEYPDVQAWAASGHGDPALGPDQTPEQAAAYQYRNSGQAEGRDLPPVTMTDPATPATPAGYVAPPGYNDPTAPNGYNPGARPTPAATHPVYTPSMLDVSLNAYQKSPDYNFRLGEGNKALDHIASSMGGIMSGARLKAADRYNQDFATTDYNNWRDYTTGQFNVTNALGNTLSQEQIAQDNADRARSDGLYQDDRGFLAGQYNNRTGQLMTLAGFGANANAQNANAATSFAASDAAQRTNAATASGNASIAGANAFTSGVNNLMTTGAYLGGQYLTAKPASYYGVNYPTDYTDYSGIMNSGAGGVT